MLHPCLNEGKLIFEKDISRKGLFLYSWVFHYNDIDYIG